MAFLGRLLCRRQKPSPNFYTSLNKISEEIRPRKSQTTDDMGFDLSSLELEADSLVTESDEQYHSNWVRNEIYRLAGVLSTDEVELIEEEVEETKVSVHELYLSSVNDYNGLFEDIAKRSGSRRQLMWLTQDHAIEFNILLIPTGHTEYSSMTQEYLDLRRSHYYSVDCEELRRQSRFKNATLSSRVNINLVLMKVLLQLNTNLGSLRYRLNNESPPDTFAIVKTFREENNLDTSLLEHYFWQINQSLLPNMHNPGLVLLRVTEFGLVYLERMLLDVTTASVWFVPASVATETGSLLRIPVKPIRFVLDASIYVYAGCSAINFRRYIDSVQVGEPIAFPELCFFIENARSYQGNMNGEYSHLKPSTLAFICANEFVRNELVFLLGGWCSLMRANEPEFIQFFIESNNQNILQNFEYDLGAAEETDHDEMG